jgi:cysteine desulfurase family protein (TIGR01976 family)
LEKDLEMNEQLFEYVRKQFPALKREINGFPVAYLDGPGGYQVPESVIAAVNHYFVNMNANVGHQFETAQNTSAMIQAARDIFADFFNCSWDEVVFGANMTTLNFALAQALVRQLKPGDSVLITELDHEANRGPWLQLADRGIEVADVAMDINTCTLDMEDLKVKLLKKPKVVAVNYACNGLGTISDVEKIIQMAHEVDALTVVDAVHYAAHGPIDVRKLDVDFLLCSAYKFFGPHIGVMVAKKEILSKLTPLNLRTQHQSPPFMLETGTLNFEGIAGAFAAVEFIADIGLKFGIEFDWQIEALKANRRNQILAGLQVFDTYEMALTAYLIEAITTRVSKATLYGPVAGHPRTSTVSLTYEGYTADQVAKYLGDKGLFVWGGHFYAIRLVEKLGLLDRGGLLRIGIAPYNSKTELDRLVEALSDQDALKRFVEAMS